jgi:hypothetical protein
MRGAGQVSVSTLDASPSAAGSIARLRIRQPQRTAVVRNITPPSTSNHAAGWGESTVNSPLPSVSPQQHTALQHWQQQPARNIRVNAGRSPLPGPQGACACHRICTVGRPGFFQAVGQMSKVLRRALASLLKTVIAGGQRRDASPFSGRTTAWSGEERSREPSLKPAPSQMMAAAAAADVAGTPMAAIKFSLKYRTAFGQAVKVLGSHPALGNGLSICACNPF